MAWLDAYIAGERDMIIKANLQGEAAGPEIITAHLAGCRVQQLERYGAGLIGCSAIWRQDVLTAKSL
jgi:hypothetical protein